MAMNLRLTEEETEQLREYASSSGRSMQDVAREAIRDYVGERKQRRDQLIARIVTEDKDLLDLLAQ
jgi:predicted transcriptional regulator